MNDILNKQEIEAGINDSNSINCQVFGEVDSTNTRMKENVYDGIYDYNLIVSDTQSMGRGRRGRVFESPKGTGIYMSLLIPVNDKRENVLLITSAAAVAVVRAIRNMTDLKPVIKWVNDIYVDGLKVCGILAEAVSNKAGEMYVILGIGINVTTEIEALGENARNIAGALFDGAAPVTRNEIISAVVNEFYEIYHNISDREYMGDYRKYSMVIGKDVRYSSSEGWAEGKALDIDNDGGLIVEADGKRLTLNTGEITLRLR